MGTKFDAATVDEELVRAYRGKQKAKTEKILDDYIRICLHKGVKFLYIYTFAVCVKFSPYLRRSVLQIQAEKLCVEMDSIEKGIVQMISENRVRKFVMGAAADKHYSTYCVLSFTLVFLFTGLESDIGGDSICRRMEDLRSKKAIFVCQHASATCHIQFICKGHHIHTRFQFKVLFSISV